MQLDRQVQRLLEVTDNRLGKQENWPARFSYLPFLREKKHE
jgi:hypothetical protein